MQSIFQFSVNISVANTSMTARSKPDTVYGFFMGNFSGGNEVLFLF